MSTSADLNWLIVRNNNSYLLKKRDIKKPFSTERNNLTNLSTFRYSGLVHKKTLAIVPAKTGITVIYKKSKYQNRPAKNTVKVTLKHGARRTLSKLRNLLKFNKYRADLRQAALRRASAVIRSQKAPKAKKARAAAAPAAAAAAAAAPAPVSAPAASSKKAE